MNEIILLRKLAEYQQYPELRDSAQLFWDESHNPEILPLLALACAHVGQPALALSSLTQAQTHQDSFDLDANTDLSAALLVLHRIDEASSLLDNVLSQNSKHYLAVARRAYCHMLQNEITQAQILFEQAQTLEPLRIPLLMNLASVYLLQSHNQKAQQLIDRAFSIIEENDDALPDYVKDQQQQQIQSTQLQVWVTRTQFSFAESWLQSQFNSSQNEDKTDTVIFWVNQYARLLAEHDYHQQATDILREYFKQFPDDNTLCLQLAELAQIQGHFMPAINLLRRALKQDEKNIALWVQLSNACLHRIDQQARYAAEKAVELADDAATTGELPPSALTMQQIQAKDALAKVESHEQNFDIAEPLFREILAENEYFLPALQGLGQQLMQQGNIDEALALFERVKAIDPVKGYSALINARHFPKETETLKKMAKAAKRPSLEGKMQAGILFQLAAAWEKRKQYDKAFAFAEQANLASKKFLPYDGKAHRNQCYRTRMRFSKALFQHREDCGIHSTLPVYVLGMPRSGTTLVEQILAGHSQIFGAGELGVIPQVVQALNRWERHTGSGRKYPDCVDDLSPYVVAGIANNLLKELQEYDPTAKHVIDKLPHNFENIGLIKFLFPNAKIISVRRDPRDIAISNYFTDYQAKHGGMGFTYDLGDIGEQLADHNLMMHHWQTIFPGEILEVNYEAVVDDLEGSARRMLDYIGVNWEPTVLKFNELDRTVKTASVWQVRQPIYTTSKAKWQRYEQYLAPIIKGTNAKILPAPITDMITLPEPGFQVAGVDFYKQGRLDEAERSFKKMLHHNPAHGASHYMLGLVYLSKNHPNDGITHIEQALEACPWQQEWHENLIKAYESIGDAVAATRLKQKYLKEVGKMQEADDALNDKVTGDITSSLAQ